MLFSLKMASPEQVKLSTFIKEVHLKLRRDTKILGKNEAWEKHCNNSDLLNKYAYAMETLSTVHWEKNNCKIYSKATSRINWIYDFSNFYFKKGGKIIQRQRELNIYKSHINISIDGKILEEPNQDEMEKLNLLDVGSCYNPFERFPVFEVLAIDIAPANEKVKKCDFLNVKVTNAANHKENNLHEIKKDHFDIVVFSLFLEYLPTSEQRFDCCKKAYDILKSEGILIIITPDSKHVGANAKIMKSWRCILAKIGFSRIKYEKLPHVHCMAFRKSLFKEVAQRWASIYRGDGFQEFVIPQDFNEGNFINAEDIEKSDFVKNQFLLNSSVEKNRKKEEKYVVEFLNKFNI